MKKLISSLVVAGVILAGSLVSAQGSLSTQVLQLLSRANSWIGTQTFFDIRVPIGATPSDTAARIYTDPGGNLYFNGGIILGAGGVTNPHNLLSSTHPDTLTGSVTRGDVIIGNSTPKWTRLGLCGSGQFIGSNGTDTVCSANGSGLTNLTAAALSGTAGAFDGNAITNLNATNLGSGTVPLARLSNVANAQIAAAAGIAYSKLALGTSIVNADIAGGAAIAYSKLALTGSIVSGDLTAGTLLFDRWAPNGATSGQVAYYNGSAWVPHTIVAGDISSLGTVTSVGLTVPGFLSVAGSPVTVSGTLAVSLANQNANIIFAGPTLGGAAPPTFRSMVNADLPLSGVGAGSYAKVTVNTAGVITSATAQASLTADVSGILPLANGGTGVSTASDDTVLIGSGAAWVAQSIPNCTVGALSYNATTNTFSCNTSTLTTHNILSTTHGDTLAATLLRGDTLVVNSTPLLARVGVGTVGQLWSSNGLDPSWSNTVARGTVTVSTPWTFTQTWNQGATAFFGIVLNVTNTASGAGSALFDLQRDSVSQFQVSRFGDLTWAGSATGSGTGILALNASNISVGTVPTARLGSGTANADSWLSGDQTYKSLDNSVTVTDVGVQNNYSITSSGQITTVYLNNASSLTITGIAISPVAQHQGKQLRLVNIGTATTTLNNGDTNSLAANRIITSITGNLVISTGGNVTLIYDSSNNWRVSDFEQGAWITRSFAAGNYTASGAMTWTVASATTDAYRLSGRTLCMAETVSGTVGGTVGLELRVAIPNSYTAAKRMYTTSISSDNGAAAVASATDAQATIGYVRTFSTAAQSATWTAGTALVEYTACFEIQ